MFIRVKISANSSRKSVQIVENARSGKKVVQKVVRYVGIAHDEEELIQLRELAEGIIKKMENKIIPSLFPSVAEEPSLPLDLKTSR